MSSKKEFIKLSWAVLEAKCIYYMMHGNHPKSIEDYEYDLLEKRYEALAKELNLEPTASNMIDFDLSRPCCKLVYSKLLGGN